MLLNQAVQGFLLTISGNGFSPVTIDNYSRQIKRFILFIGDKDVQAITTNDIREFLANIRKTPYSTPSGIIKPIKESTVFTYWRTIRSFFSWAEVELAIKRPDIAIPKPKIAKPDIQAFSIDETKALVKACEYTREAYTQRRKTFSMKRPTYLRDKFLVLLLLDTGIRVSECARLKIEDVTLINSEISIKAVGSGTKSKSRHVFIGKNCRSVAWKYLTSRKDSRPNDSLFLSENGFPMDRESIKCILKRLGERANVKNVHPHRFRHTFAIEYLRNGGDIFTLQRLLGHSSLEMVRYYLEILDSDLQEVHRKSSPVDNWHL